MLKWKILFCATFIHSMVLFAQEVPMISDDPVVNKKLDANMFDFISKILGSARLSPHLKCTLKVRHDRELRKFSSGQQWVEVLNILFNSNGFDSGNKLNFKIPATAKFGEKKSTNQWSGLGEEIKIELGDYYDHWIKFTHDGNGQIVQISTGNNLRTVPCEIK